MSETGYKSLEIWMLSREVVGAIHEMTLIDLPKFELYETGSQIRRSSKSIRANIVEGYGRRKFKNDYLKFLTYAQANLEILSKKIYRFHQSVLKNHKT